MDKVDRFALYLADGFGCKQLIFVTPSSELLRVVPVDLQRPDLPGPLYSPNTAFDAGSLEDSIIVCRAECQLHRSGHLLARVQRWLNYAPAGVLITYPDTQIVWPANLEAFLRECGLKPSFVGWVDAETKSTQRAMVAVIENNSAPSRDGGADGLRAIAFMPAYNESDLIHWSLRYLIRQGIEVYVIDNWSTDGTFEQVQEFLGKGVIGIERFPPGAPPGTYEWRSILARIEKLSEEIEADWFMLHDVDERRYSPWQGIELKAALHYVDRCGFNCIDHLVLNYWPTDNRFDPAKDVADQLRYYSFSDHLGHFHQRKVWKNPRCGVSLAPSAGHDVCFPGRLVYPFKFLLKHYPIRSQAHGERKVFADRVKRWNEAERSLGWHKQYDNIKTESFLRDPVSLECAAGAEFLDNYLIERLSGIGVFNETPGWATRPRQRFDGRPE